MSMMNTAPAPTPAPAASTITEKKKSELVAKLKEIDSLKVEVEKALAALDKIPAAPPPLEARCGATWWPWLGWWPWSIPPFPRYGDPEIYWCDYGPTTATVWAN